MLFVEMTVGQDQNGGRISACSYRSYLSYDELAPDSLLDDRLSLVSGRTSTTPGPNVALVTPNGTLYRLSDPPFHLLGDPSTGVVREGPFPLQGSDLRLEVTSDELDEVFTDDDTVDSEMNTTSVFDFAIACLRRQRPDKTALVNEQASKFHLH